MVQIVNKNIGIVGFTFESLKFSQKKMLTSLLHYDIIRDMVLNVLNGTKCLTDEFMGKYFGTPVINNTSGQIHKLEIIRK
jgi:hypothetical protein